MAYADTRPRPSPVSMGAALAVNALFITGVILAVPHISGNPVDPPLVISTFAAPPPPNIPIEINEPPPQGQSAKRQRATRLEEVYSYTDSIDVTTDIGTIDPPPLGQIGPIGPIGEISPDQKVTRRLFKDAAVNPRFRDAFQPDYPPGLIRQEIEGAVTIRVHIDTDGRVKSVEPVRFDHPELLRVTEQHALRKWRFLPATLDGIAVESWREMSVRFEIPE